MIATPTALSLVAILLSAWSLVRNHFLGPRLRISLGDSIDLVRHTTGANVSFQLACVFTNDGTDTGVIEGLLAVVHSPSSSETKCLWRLFFAYENGAQAVAQSKPYSIPVLARHTEFRGIQFGHEGAWAEGTYNIELRGWVNRDMLHDAPNLLKAFSFTIDKAMLPRLGPDLSPKLGPTLVPVAIERAIRRRP